MKRDSFVFYRSWYEAIKNLPREMQGEVLTAIMEYGLDGVTTESLKPITKAMLEMVKPQIDVNNRRFENGKNGGRPTKAEPNNNQTETKQKPKRNQNGTKTEPNVRCSNVECKIKEKSTEVDSKKSEAKASTLPKRESDFYETLRPFLGSYHPEMLRAFYDYWREPNPSRTKMRFELQKTWDVNLRLKTWANKERPNGKPKQEDVNQELAERIANGTSLARKVSDTEVPL